VIERTLKVVARDGNLETLRAMGAAISIDSNAMHEEPGTLVTFIEGKTEFVHGVYAIFNA
jgi:hypothetical protein